MLIIDQYQHFRQDSIFLISFLFYRIFLFIIIE